MEQKYLPIGSVCTLKGKNKKIMITGYYSVEFNGNLKINDYMGCAYPEGMLLPEWTCTFNHTDIETIDFIGFKNEEQRVFEGLLVRLTGNEVDEISDASSFHKENEMFLTSNSTYSKILFDENGVVMIADPVIKEEKKSNENDAWKNIKFDEKGYVISAELNENIENPFYNDYSNFSQKNEVKSDQWDIFNKVDTGEINGDIVSKTVNNSSLSKIEFDENGVVISVNGTSLQDQEEIPPIGPGLPGYVQPENKKANNYTFDAEGNLVAEETYEFDVNGNLVSINKNELEVEEKEEEIPPIGPGLPGYVEPKKEPKYKFDAEGNVISE